MSEETLDVHFFNAGIGETIVIRFPSDKWAVMDCYSSDTNNVDANPALSFLESQKVKSLEFVCLSHPHMDHFRGIRQILEEMEVKTFLHSSILNPSDIANIASFLSGTEPKNVAKAYSLLMDFVYENKNKRFDVGYMTCGQRIYTDDKFCVSVNALAPADESIRTYYKSLTSSLDACEKKQRYKPPKLLHNMISAALHIKFQEAAIILGGDVEKSGWTYSLDQLDRIGLGKIPAQVVKVSHHGSKNAYHQDFWKRVSTATKTTAVFMPYLHFSLPDPETISRISACADRLLSTWITPPLPAQTELTKRGPLAELDGCEIIALTSIFTPVDVETAGPIGSCSISIDKSGGTTELSYEGLAGKI